MIELSEKTVPKRESEYTALAFYDNCYLLAKERGINMKTLSEAIGVNNSTITHWKGGCMPAVDLALKVAKYFGVSVEYLFTGEGKRILRTDEESLLNIYNQIPEQYRGVAEAQLKALIPLKDLYK